MLICNITAYFPLILPIFLVVGWFVAPKLASNIDDKRKRKDIFARLMATRNAIGLQQMSTKEERTEFIQTLNMVPVYFNHNNAIMEMFNQFTGITEYEDGFVAPLSEMDQTKTLTDLLVKVGQEVGMRNVNISTPINIPRHDKDNK